MTEIDDRVLFGAAYYHEYQPSPRLDQDLDLMQEAGFTVIRVGESTWATWEPEDGVFDLDWLQPVLDGARARGIAVVLGTPTYAVPPWLTRKYPEIAGERRTGERIGWGARQEMDLTHAAYRFHAERVIRAVVGRYHDHPAVVGFQVDNEPGLELLYNEGVFQAFVDDLRRTYGDVETLNREWGLVYWSHRLTTWADLWRPDNNAQPQYDLAWRKFQARMVTEFIGWQAGIVREIAGAEKFVTTCIAYDRPGVQDPELTAALDVTAGNPYYAMQDGLALPSTEDPTPGWTTSGTWAIFHSADRMYSSKQARFLVTETNAGAIGGSAMNAPAFDGQWRQAAWAMIARGARMIEYWHWHTLHFGAETFWIGILPHDQRPGRVYEQLAALGAEIKSAEDHLSGLVPDATVGLLWSNESMWGLRGQPTLARDDGSADPGSYERIVHAFYRGAFEAGAPVRIVHDVQLVEQGDGTRLREPAEVAAELPVLLVPALYVASDALLDWLRDYAEAGGHLVLGPRTGYADTEARARVEVKPARLAATAGVSYQEFSNLATPVPVTGSDGALELPDGAAGAAWADYLQVSDSSVQILARYQHPALGQYPAITTAGAGLGRVTVVGTVPNAELSAALVTWAVPAHRDAWSSLTTGSVTATSATTAAGRRLRVLHNWSWDAGSVRLPTDVTDLLSSEPLAADALVELGPWDVRVFLE
ncbi:beta-galactosidase [Herbiconiux sp. CPCC 205763]|uniref:beta-galactosidase n=1 Tax=Herbiconiux aconitum TaxID=2970913 RepID=A0ABT2GN61_9MICO|nr:beta-galactosidase [Herbiconiux aconitum]MCS5717633.1 beta-galactosidase [Herbiconiux aconitum]